MRPLLDIEVRRLGATDHDAWIVLWQGYQIFYKTRISDEVSELTWHRFQDPAEPMFVAGVFEAGRLVGIVHFIFHRSCWTEGPYCYLQDLFMDINFRGKGLGRRLIEKVYAEAGEAGASRVYWLTHETNHEAIRLYEQVAERSGFVQYRKMLKTV